VALCGLAAVFYFTVMMVLPLAFLVIGSFMRRYGFSFKSPFTLAHWQNMLADPIFCILKNALSLRLDSACRYRLIACAYLIVSKRSRALSS
jgi:ABC-type spermidine/putrescine transport system permease subunit II